MATQPGRLQVLRRSVASLLPQVDKLFIYLNGFSRVPNFLKHEKITLASSVDNGELGAAGKFFFTKEVEGVYLSVDDDFQYPRDYAEKLYLELQKRENAAIVGVHGYRLRQYDHEPAIKLCNRARGATFPVRRTLHHDAPVHVAGTGVMAFDTRYWRPSQDDLKENNMCDLQIAIAAQKQQIPRVVIAHRGDWIKYLLHDRSQGTIWGAQWNELRSKRGKISPIEHYRLKLCRQVPNWSLIADPIASQELENCWNKSSTINHGDELIVLKDAMSSQVLNWVRSRDAAIVPRLSLRMDDHNALIKLIKSITNTGRKVHVEVKFSALQVQGYTVFSWLKNLYLIAQSASAETLISIDFSDEYVLDSEGSRYLRALADNSLGRRTIKIACQTICRFGKCRYTQY